MNITGDSNKKRSMTLWKLWIWWIWI